MGDSLDSETKRGWHDLVPWADPYIAALIEKLRQSANEDERAEHPDAVGELPPPLPGGPDRDIPWQADWSPRNWPPSQPRKSRA